jgi:hypothetical protein
LEIYHYLSIGCVYIFFTKLSSSSSLPSLFPWEHPNNSDELVQVFKKKKNVAHRLLELMKIQNMVPVKIVYGNYCRIESPRKLSSSHPLFIRKE